MTTSKTEALAAVNAADQYRHALDNDVLEPSETVMEELGRLNAVAVEACVEYVRTLAHPDGGEAVEPLELTALGGSAERWQAVRDELDRRGLRCVRGFHLGTDQTVPPATVADQVEISTLKIALELAEQRITELQAHPAKSGGDVGDYEELQRYREFCGRIRNMLTGIELANEALAFRTEGGSLNYGKIAAAIKHPQDYAGLYLSKPAAPASDEIHSCSLYCDRPECIKRQRDEYRASLEAPASGVDNLWRKRPVVVKATQWFKDGDHPQVRAIADTDDLYFTGMGGATLCNRMDFGVIGTLESPAHLVTPGDWIITGVQGEHYPCKPDIFAKTYEPAAAARDGDGVWVPSYEAAVLSLALAGGNYFPCKNCGHPVHKNYRCSNCKDGSPSQPSYAEPPAYFHDAPIPPARDPNAVYELEMRHLAKTKPHLIKCLRLEKYVDAAAPKGEVSG